MMRGNKRYELSYHASTKLSTGLGNVLTVISDKRLITCGSDTVYYYSADIISATDYSPFGAPMVSRTYQASEYRFSFNGKEKIDEINGAGNDLDFGARVYDARLGRWLSVDPAEGIYPSLSPYAFVANNPIKLIDPTGAVIEVAGSKREQRRINRQLGKIESSSPTGKQLIKDLRDSDKVHTISLVYGKTETATNEKGDGSGTNIQLNLGIFKRNEGGGPKFLGTAHEIGHAWRLDKDLSMTLPKLGLKDKNHTQFFTQFYAAASENKLNEEKEASHIENIIRMESGYKLRSVYSNISQWKYNALLNKVDIYQIKKTIVIKADYNYRRTDYENKYKELLNLKY